MRNPSTSSQNYNDSAGFPILKNLSAALVKMKKCILVIFDTVWGSTMVSSVILGFRVLERCWQIGYSKYLSPRILDSTQFSTRLFVVLNFLWNPFIHPPMWFLRTPNQPANPIFPIVEPSNLVFSIQILGCPMEFSRFSRAPRPMCQYPKPCIYPTKRVDQQYMHQEICC